MRVVIDTNVIVSGLRFTKGASFPVLRGVRTGAVRPVVPVALIVTSNLKDFRPASRLGVRVMTPWELVNDLDLS